MSTEPRAAVAELRAVLGGLMDADIDPRIDLPLVESMRHLVEWACSPNPDRFRRSVPVKGTDHDILITHTLVKLVRLLVDLPDAEHIHLTRHPDGTVTAVAMHEATVRDVWSDEDDRTLWVDVEVG